ncbi:MAG: DUF3576 domain-containing protein [Acetobacteraceae bacterium]|nr:DUF3576 domain-containing protein [Acetobacteraceae bacterium]
MRRALFSTLTTCAVTTLCLTALAGCSGDGIKPNPTAPGAMVDPGPQTGSVLGEEGLLGSLGLTKNPNQDANGGGGPGGIGVNAYLWRAALDTLSFMPLASADPFGGVIITDWYTPPSAPGERFKATAYILGRSLRSDGVRVNIFHQVLQNGQWMDTPLPASTVGEMENKVLARARQLREQSQISS